MIRQDEERTATGTTVDLQPNAAPPRGEAGPARIEPARVERPHDPPAHIEPAHIPPPHLESPHIPPHAMASPAPDALASPPPDGVHRRFDPDGATASWEATAAPADLPRQRGGLGTPALARVAQFVLLERLGGGGMGVVYAAFDEKLERKVAIKLVANAGNERAQQRLLREAQAQARLTHPNVVTIYEVDALPEGKLFIAMELVKGPTLLAWQQSSARRWQDILAMYAAAGQGLAAAHRAGIIHRDFKPDNVLVGSDGRVRVADFGLAFVEPPALGEAATPAAATAHGEPAAPRLTGAGMVAGTPGYMAPEQFAGAAVDARTDQFGFCVALYEALHGERPFADFAFAAGERPAPRRSEPDPRYPRWLWDVVMRGLACEPSERFPSMDALLAELTRNRGRTRRRVLAAAALAGALATVGVASAALSGERGDPPCPLATEELAGVWDAPARQRIEAALLGTRAPFAASTWSSTRTAFDRYARRWLTAQQTACEATHVRHVQSPELLDRRIECLAGRRRSLAAAADVLQGRPAQAIAHADEILASLGDIDLCADTGVLLELPGGAAAPASMLARAQVAGVRRQLASATALLAAGDVAGAAPVLASATALARAIDYDPLRAEVRYAEGRLELARGEVAEAIRMLESAVELATSSHHDELPADIWLTLAISAGTRDQRPAEIERWLGQADAWVRRLGHASDPRRVELEHARGYLQLTAGNTRDALATLTHALEAGEALWGKDDPRLLTLLRNRANAEARAGHGKPAVADDERALAIAIATWGPEYPEIARTRRSLGLLYIQQLGDVERGEREITLALHQYLAQLGGDSIEVANCEQALSVAGQYRGDYAAALEHAERAEKIYAMRLGAEHPRRGEALMGLGVLRFLRKDFARSLEAYEAAYPILRAALGPAHTTVGLLLSNTGETLLALDRAEAAETDFAQALDILQRSLGPDHVDLALPLKGLGLAQLRRGRPRGALAPLERALALRTRSSAGDPQELAEIRWALARTLHALGREPARARELAQSALAGYRDLGSESAGKVQEIARWLASSPRRSGPP